MALKLLGESEPPEFSLLKFIEKANVDLYLEGINPLSRFQLDSTHHSVDGLWRPSGLRRCMRKQVYKACRVQKKLPPFDPKKQFMFDRGHIFGAWMAAYVSMLEGRYGFSIVSCEVVLTDDETSIGGKADVVLTKGGTKYVVEVKSKDNAAAMHNISPSKNDLSQLNDYMFMSNARAGWLVYFGVDFVDYVSASKKPPRTTIAAKEFFHRFSSRMWKETCTKVEMLSWFLRDQTKLAPKTTNTFFECPGCEWRWACDQELNPVDAKA